MGFWQKAQESIVRFCAETWLWLPHLVLLSMAWPLDLYSRR